MAMLREVYDSSGNFISPVLECKDKSLAKQSESKACDINVIMKGYEKTGLISHLSERPGEFLDVSTVPDFQAALAIVERAESAFMDLPGAFRARFDNDPVKYLEWVHDPKSRDEMMQLGLIEKPKEGTVVATPASPPLPVEGVVS